MFARLNYFKLCILATLLLLALPRSTSSPLHGGEKHHYDKSAVAREFNPKQVTLAAGIAECVRTAWIGPTNNRTVICVEWRMIRGEGK